MRNDTAKFKIALVGLGAAGSVIARFFQKDGRTEEIVCFARNIRKAREFLPDGTKKIILKKIDAVKEKKRLAKEISGVDLIINAASSKINLAVMDAACEAGVNYLDMASEHLHDPFRAEQLEFDRKFKKRGLKGLICAGAAPGISNLLIAGMAGDFDSIDAIRLRLAEHLLAEDVISSWSPELAIEELAQEVPVYEKGRFSLRAPFSDEEIYSYPEPFGKMPATLLCQDEQITVPLFIKTKNMDAKSGGSDIESMKLLYRLGFFSEKITAVKGVKIRLRDLLEKIVPPTPSPREMSGIVKKGIIREARFGIVAEINGRRENRKTFAKGWVIFPSIFEINRRMPGATYISYPTGLAAYLFAKILPDAGFAGVIPPEALGPEISSRIMEEVKQVIEPAGGKMRS